jgi:hypothetical protein
MNSRIELAQYFNQLGFKVGAEVGVAGGDYSEKLCKAIPDLKLFCIDPWDTYQDNRRGGGKEQHYKNYEKTKARLAPYNATLIRKFSTEAARDFADNSLDFVFLDGNHDFDYVMEDIITWSRKVRKGGIISGHDLYFFNNSGVIEAVLAYTQFHKIKLNFTKWNDSDYKDDRPQCFWWVK